MKASTALRLPSAAPILLTLLVAAPVVADPVPFPGSSWFINHAGDYSSDFGLPSCQDVQTAFLHFVVHPDACTGVIADVYVDDTRVGSTGMLGACQESPRFDVTAFLMDGAALVSLRNPRCPPGVGCCGVADSTVATWGGYLYLQGSTTPVSVQEDPHARVINRLDVQPNPSAGSFRYGVTTGRPSRVRVDLCDTAGRLVETLLDDRLQAGRHSYFFQRAGGSSRPIAPGVYFLRLRVSGQQQAQKVVVLR